MEVCPVQDEQMLDIIDIRRQQVMIAGDFPVQLQTAFRGMERAKNPWGINHDQRLAWAEGLEVKTIDENPQPDVLYWVGCAASYDPQVQKTARAFVQLLTHAGVNFAVLGKKECCTGDSARRAGNEFLYRQLADQNVATLTAVNPKLIVATCPHCLNSIGNEYRQIGGDYKVVHHTQYLESLVADGRLAVDRLDASITYHDPCYLGRHNGVYDAPRNVLRVLSNEVLELERSRENSFCCGAGGAQFWKEEEEGDERISDNRFREVEHRLEAAQGEKVLAVGCPFCKSMLNSTPTKAAAESIAVKDIAELLLESVQKKNGVALVSAGKSEVVAAVSSVDDFSVASVSAPSATVPTPSAVEQLQPAVEAAVPSTERKKWTPKVAATNSVPSVVAPSDLAAAPAVLPAADSVSIPAVERKKWAPKVAQVVDHNAPASPEADLSALEAAKPDVAPVERKKWQPKAKPANPDSDAGSDS
jgi:Fe-S oxidoreductase